MNLLLKIAVTGHRMQRLQLSSYTEKRAEAYRNKLSHAIENIFNQAENITAIKGITGMSDGADTLFLQSLLSLKQKREFPIKISVLFPCKNYRLKGKETNDIFKQAAADIDNIYHHSNKNFYGGCEDLRDKRMVAECDVLIALVDGHGKGGAYRTIAQAQKMGREIVEIKA